MDYIESYSHDPQWNLALEQYVFDEMDRSRSYVMLWQNHNAIVVGKNQNTVNEVNSDYVRRHGITVVRRLSGGGAVYHDLGNLNFTFITDADDSQRIDLHMFCIPIVETLRSFGVTAQISGRNDITVDGKKFSGNSQYVREHRVMHHGTILFDSDLSVVSEALSVDRDKLTAKGIASVRSRVTNLRPYLPQGTSLDDFKRRLLEYLSVESPVIPHPLTAEDEKRIAEIRAERYATWEWNYGCSPEYTDVRRRRFDGCGEIEVSLLVAKGTILDIRFHGDFFGASDLSGLCGALVGCPCRLEQVESRLEALPVAKYIYNITPRQLAELITR